MKTNEKVAKAAKIENSKTSIDNEKIDKKTSTKKLKTPELLAPVGSPEKLEYAINYGADAVFLAGKNFGLRAMAANFTDEQLEAGVKFAHSKGRRVYVTLNIFAKNHHFKKMVEYIKFLEKIEVDAVICADIGIMKMVADNSKLKIHVSTQANVLNFYALKVYADLGVKRIVLARELHIDEVKEISNLIKKNKLDIELECFVHGALCMAYSGRCLLSNYLTGRNANEGECVQACRWKYEVKPIQHNSNGSVREVPKGRPDTNGMVIEEDSEGTYFMNSKDLCLIEHLKEMAEAGVDGFKVEGRMKSVYYVASVINAYRKTIDNNYNASILGDPIEELNKTAHREYTTGFMFGDDKICNIKTSSPTQDMEFVAVVDNKLNAETIKKVIEKSTNKDYLNNLANDKTQSNLYIIEQRNRFKIGDEVEILSPSNNFNKTFIVESLTNLDGEIVEDAKEVQQKLILKCDIELQPLDILRKLKVN
jgi:putative protease